MAYLDRWKTIFPEVVGSEARPDAPIDNTLALNTDGFPQFIANDPVGYTLQNAFLMQLFSNDARLGELVDDLDTALDEHKNDTGAHAKGISGNAASATQLKNARTIDGIAFDGTAAVGHFGSCSTAAGTAAKAVNCAGFTLVVGAEITVKFTVTNTAANPTLNVSDTGAKAIQYRGSAISAGYLAANRTYRFVYDGTNYQLIGDLDTNTTYGNMTAATASAAGKAGLVPAPAAGKQGQFLRGDGTWQTPTNTDTHYTTHLYAGSGAAADAATTNGNTKLTVVDNTTVRDTVTLKGTGATTVTSDANGVITIHSTDNDTKYAAGTERLYFLGTNVTGGTGNDTKAWWQSKGNCIAYFNKTGQVNGQPAQFGFIINLVSGGEVHQEWWTQCGGAHYHRGGNGSTTAMPNWTANDTNTTYGNMTAATASAAGKAGLVPAPAAGKQGQFLRGDGTWQTPTNTNTHYTTHLYAGSGAAADAATTNGNTKLTITDDSTVRDTVTIKGTGATTVTSDANGVITIHSTDNNTTYSNFVKSGSGAKAGLVPAPSTTAGTTKYLREDGTWQVPPDHNTTYSNMTAATASAAGKAGLVPAPAAGKQGQFLRGDGTWQTPTNTTYSAGTTAQLTTGTDTANRVWPAKQIADYVKGTTSLAQNGYWKAPNGLIIQWGNVPDVGLTDKAITFPISFSTACYSVSFTYCKADNGGAGADNNDIVRNPTKTGMTVYMENYCTAYWIAIGK